MTDVSPRDDATRSLRRVRRAQIAIFSLVGVALVGTAVNSFVGAGRVYQAVALGQGQGLLQALRHSIGPGGPFGPGGPPSREELEGFLDANADLGLRCIASFRPGDREVVRVGDCQLSSERMLALIAAGPPDRVVEIDGRVAMVDARPGGPGGPGGPAGRPPGEGFGFRPPRPPDDADIPPPGAFRGGRGEDRWRRPPPRGPIVIEYEPVEANALRGAATTGLATAIAAVAALIAAGFALARLSRRAESLQDAAERQRQLAGLGEMSAVLAHEIRNPLASLKGHAQLLLETLDPAGREHAKAERVVREATRIEELSEDLLSLVRSSRVEPVAVDPGAIVREVAQALGAERFAIDTSHAPRSWRLDAARIRQVLENLLQNALEASPPDAPIEVRVSSEAGRGLVIAVSDRGPGVAPGDESRIFEPFVTGRVRGTGLGLAVARRIVELHGGQISVRNRASGGAEFRVVLP